jgi:hypothetical protein
MAIYKVKRFSFMENLKGNPKIKEAFLAWNKNKIDPEIGNDPLLKNVPKELKSYITFLYEHVPTDEKGIGGKPLFLMSYEKVMEQLDDLYANALRVNDILSGNADTEPVENPDEA